MKRAAATVLGVLLLAAQAFGQQPVPLEIVGDTKVVKVDRVVTIQEDRTVVSALPFAVKAPPGAAFYFWQAPAGVESLDQGDTLRVTKAPQGQLTIAVKYTTVEWEAKKFVAGYGSVTFNVGAVPAPTPPQPPDPKPDPPAPKPAPSADPIGAGGFAVLMSFDSTKTTRPPAELSVLHGKAVREYLEAKCVADPTRSDWKAYRIYPDNTVGAPKLWADAFAKKGGADWILIGTGNGGYSGPLPKTEAEALALLKKYGG